MDGSERKLTQLCSPSGQRDQDSALVDLVLGLDVVAGLVMDSPSSRIDELVAEVELLVGEVLQLVWLEHDRRHRRVIEACFL